MTEPATILICTQCKGADPVDGAPTAGTSLADACAALAVGQDVQVIGVRCFANCKRGPSAVVRHPGRWTYVFGDLDPAADAAALIAGARLLAGAADGLLPWRGRPDCLKRGMIARIPPIDFTGDPA